MTEQEKPNTESRPTFDRDDLERLKALFVRARVGVLCQPYMEMTPQAARLHVDAEMANMLTLYASQPPNPISQGGSVSADKPTNPDCVNDVCLYSCTFACKKAIESQS